MRHSLTQLLAASGGGGGGGSPERSESPAAVRARSPGRAPASAREAAGGEAGERRAAPAPRDMEEEALAGGPGEDADAMDFLSGLELADLLDPRPPDWASEAGPGSPGPPSSSGGGSDGGGRWRGDDDDDAAAAEMQRFSDLLQRLLDGIGGERGGGGERAGGERRRRKGPGGGGGAGAGGGEPGGPAAAAAAAAQARSPRKAAAAAARLNRLKKKEYVMGLESRVRGLAAENQELRAENRELGRRVAALQEESRYLRAVLANETGLARLLSRLSGVGLRLTTSLFRDAPAGDHDYALPVGKPPAAPREDEEPAGGVCLHVDRDRVSVEFCAACARKAAAPPKV